MLTSGFVRRFLFEMAVLFFFALYVILCLSPSSYGLVLNMFGENANGLLWGAPRSIRSDEWAVWTPYFQSLVNNDFARINLLSLYREDFRGFSALPIQDWALLFKPLLWPFLVLNEAYAFSLHHALIMVVFILGWKRLVDELLPEAQTYSISGWFSLLLFFSGFAQVWWTTLGPVLAVTPWLFIVLFRCEKVTFFKAMLFSYVSIVWLLSHTYPPIIISTAYLAFILVVCFKRDLCNRKTIVSLGLSAIIALAVVYFYFYDVIQIVAQTVYPGKRISGGGAVPWEVWASIFAPYINHSNYQPLFSLNICELGVVTSLLPIMVCFFVRFQSFSKESVNVILCFCVFVFFISLWMLIPFNPLLARIMLFDQIPGLRFIWVLGLAINLLALYMLVSSEVSLSLLRLFLFSVLLLGVYTFSSVHYDLPLGKKSAWELLSIVVLIGVFLFSKERLISNKQKVFVLVFTSALINFCYFGLFNPGQKAKPIFALKNSTAVQALKEKQNLHPNGWLVTSGYPGAVLQGVGLNSVSHVLMTPKLSFFRELFPSMDAAEFNNIFNRYAHIHLTDDLLPNSPQADVINVPKHVFGADSGQISKASDVFVLNENLDGAAGFIDSFIVEGARVSITGWGMISSVESVFLSNYKDKLSIEIERVSRPDVVAALNDARLADAGFILRFDAPSAFDVKTFCLYTKDKLFGVRKVLPGSEGITYKCSSN